MPLIVLGISVTWLLFLLLPWRSWRCLFWNHHWVVVRDDHYSKSRVCQRCGRSELNDREDGFWSLQGYEQPGAAVRLRREQDEHDLFWAREFAKTEELQRQATEDHLEALAERSREYRRRLQSQIDSLEEVAAKARKLRDRIRPKDLRFLRGTQPWDQRKSDRELKRDRTMKYLESESYHNREYGPKIGDALDGQNRRRRQKLRVVRDEDE